MTLTQAIHRAFRKSIHFFRIYLLPLCLILTYLSAYHLLHPLDQALISRADLLKIHRLSGFVILYFLFLLTYNWLDRRVNPNGSINSIPKSMILAMPFGIPLRILVDRIFYLVLTLLGLLGFFYYLSKKKLWTIFDQSTHLLVLHESLGWCFITLLITKIYFDVTLWSGKLIRNFKEY